MVNGEEKATITFLDIRITELTIAQRQQLLQLARSALRQYLRSEKQPHFKVNDPLLNCRAGAFVTLREKVCQNDIEPSSSPEEGLLRGCIGRIQPDYPLHQTVEDMAIQAATGDYRFPAVTFEELDHLSIEISILSPLEKINRVEQIKVGSHGLIVASKSRRGLLLPQVAPRYGWTPQEFASFTCRKAGLPDNYWQKDAELFVFSTLSFSDID